MLLQIVTIWSNMPGSRCTGNAANDVMTAAVFRWVLDEVGLHRVYRPFFGEYDAKKAKKFTSFPLFFQSMPQVRRSHHVLLIMRYDLGSIDFTEAEALILGFCSPKYIKDSYFGYRTSDGPHKGM